jgi:hypothetical protein
MWNTIVTASGWSLFFCVLLLYIRSVAAERTFFAGRDAEHWEPTSQVDGTASPSDGPEPVLQFPSVSSLGRPA